MYRVRAPLNCTFDICVYSLTSVYYMDISKIFPEGAPTTRGGQLIIRPNSPENCMTMTKNWTERGRTSKILLKFYCITRQLYGQ